MNVFTPRPSLPADPCYGTCRNKREPDCIYRSLFKNSDKIFCYSVRKGNFKVSLQNELCLYKLFELEGKRP